MEKILVNPLSRLSTNHCVQNIADLSGNLFTLRIQYDYTQTQYKEGAREVNNIWYAMITFFMKYFQLR